MGACTRACTHRAAWLLQPVLCCLWQDRSAFTMEAWSSGTQFLPRQQKPLVRLLALSPRLQ